MPIHRHRKEEENTELKTAGIAALICIAAGIGAFIVTDGGESLNEIISGDDQKADFTATVSNVITDSDTSATVTLKSTGDGDVSSRSITVYDLETGETASYAQSGSECSEPYVFSVTKGSALRITETDTYQDGKTASCSKDVIVDEIVKNKYEFKCQVKDWLTSIIPSFNNKDMKFSYELHFSDYWESICSKSAEERMDQSSLADFVTPDDPYVKGIADFIKKEMTGFKATELETANAILRLSQSFKYVYDSDQFGCEEYYMKPAELLYTQKGDCEDHAIFCASVMEALGYDSVLFLIETPYGGHAAAGVSVPGASEDYQTYNGTRYYFCEATATYGGNTYINYTSIDIGNMPDGYTVLKIIPVP